MRIALYFHYMIFFAKNGLKSNYDWIKKSKGFLQADNAAYKNPFNEFPS